jgi:RNA polymerase sigma factor (sigma-70 family)
VDQREAVERAGRGDHDAFALLVRRAAPRLDAVARLVLGDAELARDVVQEALTRAWRDLPGLREADRFDGWLYRITIRTALEEARRRQRRAIEIDIATIEPIDASGHLQVEQRDELESGFRRLDPDQRALVVLHYYLDLSVPDIATALSVPLGTVKSRLHRAVLTMRAALDAEARVQPRLQEGQL